METKELLKKVRKIEIKTRRLSDNLFGGEYHSTFKGRGMTFSEVRPYQFGDDVRAIDWNVTARYNEPFVKVFEEERELTMMLLVDISGSGIFGTKGQSKREILTEIAATLAFSALQNNDKVGLLLFSDRVERFIPPKKGKGHVLRIIRELLEAKPIGKGTDLSAPLAFLGNALKKKAIVFTLSDFMCSGYQKTLQITGKKHDITGIRVYDALDAHWLNLGLIPVQDAETGAVQWMASSSKAVRKAYEASFSAQSSYFQQAHKKSGCGRVDLELGQDYVAKLLGYFKQRH